MAGPAAAQQRPEALAQIVGNQPNQLVPTRLSNFDALQANINNLLYQIGVAIAPSNTRSVEDRRRLLTKIYGETNTRAQEICDRIEDEINKAKALMRQEYARYLHHEGIKRKQVAEQLAAHQQQQQQKLASTKAAAAAIEQKSPALVRTPMGQADLAGLDVMDIDDLGTPSSTIKNGMIIHSSPANLASQNTAGTMLAAPTGVSPAPVMDIETLLSEVAPNTATPNAALTAGVNQAASDDDVDMFGGADTVTVSNNPNRIEEAGDDADGNGNVASLLPGLENYADSNDAPVTSISRAASASLTQPADNFGFSNNVFAENDAKDEGDENHADGGVDNDEFQSWLDSIQ